MERIPFRATTAASPYADLRLPVSLLLDNIRSMYNVGAFFRTADGAGVERLFAEWNYGPSSKERHHKNGAWSGDPASLADVADPKSELEALRSAGYEIAAIETSDRALDIFEWQPQFPVCVLFGHEVDGLSKDLLELCDTHVRIPMLGLKHSLNVASAGAIVMYELLRKYRTLHTKP